MDKKDIKQAKRIILSELGKVKKWNPYFIPEIFTHYSYIQVQIEYLNTQMKYGNLTSKRFITVIKYIKNLLNLYF